MSPGRRSCDSRSVTLQKTARKGYAVKPKETQLTLGFGEERIWERLPPRIQQKVISICVQMVLQVFQSLDRGVSESEPQDHS